MQVKGRGRYRSILCSSNPTESVKTAVSTRLHFDHAWVAE